MPSVLECLPKCNSVSCPSIPIRESPLPESFLSCPFKQVPRFHTFPTRNACYIQSGRNIQMHRSTPSTEDLRRGFQPLADHGFVFSNHMLGSTHVNDASTTPPALPNLGSFFRITYSAPSTLAQCVNAATLAPTTLASFSQNHAFDSPDPRKMRQSPPSNLGSFCKCRYLGSAP